MKIALSAEKLAELAQLLAELDEIYEFWSDFAEEPQLKRERDAGLEFRPPDGFLISLNEDGDVDEETGEPDQVDRGFPTEVFDESVNVREVCHKALIAAYRKRAHDIAFKLVEVGITDLPEPPKGMFL